MFWCRIFTSVLEKQIHTNRMELTSMDELALKSTQTIYGMPIFGLEGRAMQYPSIDDSISRTRVDGAMATLVPSGGKTVTLYVDSAGGTYVMDTSEGERRGDCVWRVLSPAELCGIVPCDTILAGFVYLHEGVCRVGVFDAMRIDGCDLEVDALERHKQIWDLCSKLPRDHICCYHPAGFEGVMQKHKPPFEVACILRLPGNVNTACVCEKRPAPLFL